jgi:FMN phosphatase YigB (HAD superfamily)
MAQKRYRVIFWDVDGTLLDFLASERWALKEAFRCYGMEIDEEINAVYSAINLSFWKRLERQEIDKMEVLRGRFFKLFEEFGPGGMLSHKDIDHAALAAIDVEDFRLIYQKNLGSVYFYLEDSLTLCEKLREEGFSQYIITNGEKWTQNNKLRLAGFDKVMDDIFVSEDIGFPKPDARFFEGCFAKIREKSGMAPAPSEILVVGDSLTSDMQGAENAGMDACLYLQGQQERDAAELPKSVKYQIKSLWDLGDIVWQNQQIKN